MLVEDQRFLHEDLERLEQAISDRVLEDPKNPRERLTRDHQVANFLDRISQQSSRLIDIYKDDDGGRAYEIQTAGTGDTFESFYNQLKDIKDFHRRYPNETVENLDKTYKRKAPAEGESWSAEVDNLFTGEEAYGRFFDLTSLHEQYLNIPGVSSSRRFNYLQYLDFFDHFTPPQCVIKPTDKLKDEYFQYVGELAAYLESFMRRTRPLEPVDNIFSAFDNDFEEAWESNKLDGWNSTSTPVINMPSTPPAEGTGEGIWCSACQKEFKNENVYRHHLTNKKHKNAEARKASETNGTTNGTMTNDHAHTQASQNRVHRLKERAVAEREYRVAKLAKAMSATRSDTKVNVERRAGMTERERQQEMEAMYAESAAPTGEPGDDVDSDGEEKIYNPLKLPLDWTGKPIPFWLYKLHGLGVEYTCEICGNFVYMGRRAFDKHFNEARHIYGLKCLGITNTTLFREITSIDEAQKLWSKLSSDKLKEKKGSENVVQMEDGDGNVMPEKVYLDLQKQGLV